MEASIHTKVTNIPLSLIQPSNYNPRKTFDEQGLTELADSIRQQGVLQPIGVRLIPDTDRYEIVFGERRYRASLIAGNENIPAVVFDSLSDKDAEEMAITENLQRQDIAPMEEANAFKLLIDSGRYDAQSLAVQVGKSVTYIRTRMRLTTLIPEIASLLDTDDITVGVASEICRYGEEIQYEVYNNHLRDGLPYNSWRGMAASKVARMIESGYTTELCRYNFDKSACASCPHNTCNLLLFVEDGYEGKCANASCLKEKHAAHITDKALSMLAEHPEANFCHYQYDINEAVAVRLTEIGYEIESVSDYPNRFPIEPEPPQKEDYDTEDEYAEAIQGYEKEKQKYEENRADLLSRCNMGEASLYIWIGSNDAILSYRSTPLQQREDSNASNVKIAELEAKDGRNKEIAVERTIEDTKKQILDVEMADTKFTNEEDRMIYFFLLSSLRKEHYEAVGITARETHGTLTDKEKMTVITNLNAKTKAIIRRDFLIANFQGAYRSNAISELLFTFAKKHMPEEFAAIESQYNEVYEKRHKRLEERMAQLKPKEVLETTAIDETSTPREEFISEAPNETETAQSESDGDASTGIGNDTEEAAA